MNHFRPPHINKKTYVWSVRAFSTVKRILGVKIKLHSEQNQIETGDIFLFNHFSRFETFIPQYLMYQENQSFCRSVAASDFFQGDPRFTQYLYNVGAIPNDIPNLFSELARDALKGYKIIIFPEGGMIKDRKVLGEDGDFEIFSPTANSYRKHHSGAARLAYVLNLLKNEILQAEARGDYETIMHWCDELEIDNVKTLIRRCKKSTQIVPSNITFYPIRLSENFLKKTVEKINNNLSPKYKEELLIEGNLVFKDTDMDIRLGDPIEVDTDFKKWGTKDLQSHVENARDLQSLFAFSNDFMNKSVENLRDQSMKAMYGLVTVNLSHLASMVILKLVEDGIKTIELKSFYKLLYLAARYVNHGENCHLHGSLLRAETYIDLALGKSPMMDQFLRSAERAKLIKIQDHILHFMNKLEKDHEFHQVRMENPICVYANECAPIKDVTQAVKRAFENEAFMEEDNWAQLYFEDELLGFEADRDAFDDPKYEEINHQETAYRSGAPYYLQGCHNKGVLLVHGFLASPSELSELGQKFARHEVDVFGVRLSGHGTSPHDLKERTWREWEKSVQHGYEILAQTCDEIAVVGFSTGGALALKMAAQKPEKLVGVSAISTPLYFANPNLRFVPMIHHANRLASWIASQEGVLPFILNNSEHPDINYRHIPIRALYELRKFIAKLDKCLDKITCPVQLIQADQDKVVQPRSAAALAEKLENSDTEVQMISSDRHGIVTENIGQTSDHILNYIMGLYK